MALPNGLPQVSDLSLVKEILTGSNLIINGDMAISQRGTSFISPAGNTYTVDRFSYYKTLGTTHTITQDTDVPTFAQSGHIFQSSRQT